MLAAVDFDFYWLQNVNVLLQTPIEIKSYSMIINQTLAMTLPQAPRGYAIVRYCGMPNCKEKRSIKWLKVQSLVVHTPGKTS